MFKISINVIKIKVIYYKNGKCRDKVFKIIYTKAFTKTIFAI